MRQKKKKEKELRLAEMSAVRKKNVGDYFLNTSRWHREWLKALAERYKERGEFPVMALTLLPSYYDSIQDKEVAAFAALLFNDGENTLERVSSFRKMFGKSPWEWFEQRMFVSLSFGRNRNKQTGGIQNWKIANLFGRLWNECHVVTYEIPSEKIEQTIVRPIGVQVEMIAKTQHCSYFDVLTYMLEDGCVGHYFYKLRLLLQILACSDGFSFGLWTVDPSELKCPITHDLRVFLQTWFPDYRTYGGIDDAIRLFGFERDCDFFYAYLGYKELQKRNPKRCSECATKYLSWYEGGYRKKPYQWREILPEISL